MDPKATVQSIGDAIAALDTQLQSGNPPINSAQWQQLHTSRENLDDQQQALVLKDVQADNASVQNAAATIATAIKSLQADINQQGTIDTIIKYVTQISAAADAILKSS
jgi:hypothetical protein